MSESKPESNSPDPEIVYEGKDFLALIKPAGLQVHRARISASAEKRAARAKRKRRPMPEEEPTLVDWLVARYPEIRAVGDDPVLRPGIVHRLDKATSGIMIVARTPKSFSYLKALFQKHEIKKIYIALVAGVPREERGIIDAPIGIRTGTLKRSVRSMKMAKEAVTEYKVVEIIERPGADRRPARYARLEVAPRTGRTHQIRVHLSSIGHPVVGDRLYGPKRQPAWADRLMLHAFSLEFMTPSGRRLHLEAEAPF